MLLAPVQPAWCRCMWLSCSRIPRTKPVSEADERRRDQGRDLRLFRHFRPLGAATCGRAVVLILGSITAVMGILYAMSWKGSEAPARVQHD
jgi:hypothetical protein